MSKIYNEDSNAERVAAIYWTIILGFITAVFVLLRITGVTHWDWWYIVSPLILLDVLLIAIWIIYIRNRC